MQCPLPAVELKNAIRFNTFGVCSVVHCASHGTLCSFPIHLTTIIFNLRFFLYLIYCDINNKMYILLHNYLSSNIKYGIFGMRKVFIILSRANWVDGSISLN